jgi:hypothetical protein
MKNNRCGPHVKRGDTRQRSGSRGDPPLNFKIRGDPQEIIEIDSMLSKGRFLNSKTYGTELVDERTLERRNGLDW